MTTFLAEHDSGKAARILTAARELVLKRGVRGLTVAEIAEKAHVGKGTTYLYWPTKEDLLFGLFTRDFLAFLDVQIEALSTDLDACRPHRLCPQLTRNALNKPFVHALQSGDADLLGALAQHPRSMELLDLLGPAAVMYTVLPVWRRHRLARTDWPLDELAYALHALMTGFVSGSTRPGAPNVTVDDPDKVMAAAVTALLGPEEAGPSEIRATAEEGLQALRERRETVLCLITTTDPQAK
ncbi:helix-turn-helix transcriptional regulator [Streptomyces phaeolivaceus]|uniref:Helix-turn-helix transcriptional regulator n=1 Tax=Streptomyces phaeolivaceus TaxID=2653200 RepID=A0A5P8KFZ2_9ACTN|nr:helix-turn-helix domain-containing protein [Streptomyces phaeolivaceus]QFR01679.1 helix-turn-helix transcriptional regulator [Streptomyces phaeolivaceus]